MNNEEEIMTNKAAIKLNKLKVNAIINLLSKEGILTHWEVDEEVGNLIEQKSEESEE